MIWKQNRMWCRKPSLIAWKQIDAINETDKPQSSQIKKDKSVSNEPNKGMSLYKSSSLDKSRASQITETEDTVKTLNKPGSI